MNALFSQRKIILTYATAGRTLLPAMIIRIFSATLVAVLFAACATTPIIQVLDAGDKLPVAGAKVTAVNGDLSSAPVYTDAAGEAAAPELPNGTKAVVISKPGYVTKTAPILP